MINCSSHRGSGLFFELRIWGHPDGLLTVAVLEEQNIWKKPNNHKHPRGLMRVGGGGGGVGGGFWWNKKKKKKKNNFFCFFWKKKKKGAMVFSGGGPSYCHGCEGVRNRLVRNPYLRKKPESH